MSILEAGTVDWIKDRLEAQGGEATLTSLEEALQAILPPADGDGTALAEALALLHTRLAASPLFVTLSDGKVALTRRYLQGAYFRYTPTTWELEHGVLRVDGTELMLVHAQGEAAPDQELCWRDVDEGTLHRARLAHSDGRRVLPGLADWYVSTGFQPGDDMVVHVREVDVPLFVFARASRFDRDEGPISRRNARMAGAAIALLAEMGETWMPVDRLLKLLVARFDFRSPTPPDSFSQRLLSQDNRFTLSPDGREVRLSHFHHEDTARAYLARLGSPLEALPVFLEEYPPRKPGDRDRAIAYLEQLWQHVPRPELHGLTPAHWTDPRHKIVPFGRRDSKT